MPVREADGTYRTYIVRRARPENEGPDDVSPSGYRAELIPLRFQVVPDEAPGRLRALIDINGFSSWARRHQPALRAPAPSCALPGWPPRGPPAAGDPSLTSPVFPPGPAATSRRGSSLG